MPFGGLLAIDLKAGETLLVSGATGNYGRSAALMALALGAGRVVAPGRNAAMLAGLDRRFGDRVRTVRLTGNGEADTAVMQGAAGGPIDAVLDLLPPVAPASAARAAIVAVRPYGGVVLMAGVGLLGGDDLALPYPWIMRDLVRIQGQWMYEPAGRSLGGVGACRAVRRWPIRGHYLPTG